MRWGLLPSWAKDPAIGNQLVNARAETVEAKPAFRTALLEAMTGHPVSSLANSHANDSPACRSPDG